MSVSSFLSSIGVDAGGLLGRCGLWLIIAFTVLQIAPIKVNPWTWIGKLLGRFFGWLGKRIGKAINGDVVMELEGIKDRLTELEEHDEKQDATRDKDKALDARRRILRFADEVRRKEKHSLEHFNNILDDITYYKNYCKTHKDFANDRARISIKIIEDVYEECTLNNSFLGGPNGEREEEKDHNAAGKEHTEQP